MSSPNEPIIIQTGKKGCRRGTEPQRKNGRGEFETFPSPCLGVSVANIPGVNRLRALLGDCRGALLLETVIASMVFALVGVAVLAGLSTAYTSGSLTDEQSVAENVARNQMEFVFGQVYREPQQTPYPTMTGIPAGYSVSTTVDFGDPVDPDPEVEKITVTSSHDGKDILTLQTLRGRDDGLQLRYSANPDRSDSARLHGATVGGDLYVFLDDPELRIDDQVVFYLDSALERTENYIHWDFKGSGGSNPSDPANIWDTDDPSNPVVNGTYTIKAVVSLLDGNTVNVTATFDISN